jgi:hypothetical protein
MTYEDWVQYGQQHGWIGPIVCATHDGVPTSEAEDYMWEDGDDPCIWITRHYEDEDVRKAVENNHPATCWR